MRIELKTIAEWRAADFLQSRFWAGFKGAFGWESRGFQVDSPELGLSFPLSVMIRRLRAGRSFAYIPHGPAAPVPEGRQGEFLAALAASLAPELPSGCAFIRFDPAWHRVEAIAADAPDASGDDEPDSATRAAAGTAAREAPGIRPAYDRPLLKGSDVQPPDTVLLDLGGTEDAILAGMKPKWRYNIRLAAKKGVTVSDEGALAVDTFYSLYETTARRDGIALHPEAYYRELFRRAGDPAAYAPAETRPDLRLWVARHEGDALAAIITVFHGDQAIYLYGASSDAKRNLMPAYALQWEAIRAAKAAGCSSYDFFGIPPRDDSSHAMAGLYRFKTGFGGAILHYAGAWDYPIRGLEYGLFRSAERLRLFWHKTVKKRLGRTRSRT